MRRRSAAILALAVVGAAACSGSDGAVAPIPSAVAVPAPVTGAVDDVATPLDSDIAPETSVESDPSSEPDAGDVAITSTEPPRTLIIDEPATVDPESATPDGRTKEVARSVAADELPEGFIPGIEPVGFDVMGARITSADGEICEVCLWLAADADERSQGLRGVTDLGGPVGMLFRWDEPTGSNFFMFETPMPLSIAWFDGDGAFVDATDMEPCIQDSSSGCIRYGAGAEYRFAIEVVRGELDVLGIGPGATLEVVDADAITDCSIG